MKEFSFSTRIFFGEGALERLRKVSGKRVLIVTDKFMYQSGVADRVASHLTDCEVTVFPDVVPDPPIETVAAGVKVLQECRAQVMVAVGGGSSIDAAKAIRALGDQLADQDTQIMECFAIPTTSGTGSEVTEYAVITDVHKGVVYIRLTNGVNAIAHSCYDRRRPGKKDDVSFVVTGIDQERGVALGIVTRIIRQNL